MRGRCAHDPRLGGVLADPGDHERHPGGLVVEVEPLLVQPAVRAEQIAVVGGADQHRVLRTAVRHGAAHPVDRGVDLGVQPVVEVAVPLRVAPIDPLDGRCRAVTGVVGLAEGDLRGGFGPQILVGGRCRWHRRRIDARWFQRTAPDPRREQHDVVRVHEARDQQERSGRGRIAGAAARVAVDEPGDHPIGDQRVAAESTVGQARAVRFGADPPGEAECRQRVGIEIPLHGGRVDDPVVVVGGQRSAGGGVVQVGVRDVPLAVVVGVVSRRAEPVAQGGHLAAPQPAHPGVVIGLADAVGLGDTVQVRVLAGEDGRTARDTRQRSGVVPGEADAVLVEPAPAGQGAFPPGEDGLVLIGRDGAFLVGHHDDDVGAVSHGSPPFGVRVR